MDFAGPIPLGPPDAPTSVDFLLVTLLVLPSRETRATDGRFAVLAASLPPTGSTVWGLDRFHFCSCALCLRSAQEMPLFMGS